MEQNVMSIHFIRMIPDDEHMSPLQISRQRAELRHRHAGLVELLEGERHVPRLVHLRMSQISAIEAEIEYLDCLEAAELAVQQ